MSSQLDKIARLNIELLPKLLPITGVREFDRFMASMESGSKRRVALAKMEADVAARESQRAARAVVAENDRIMRSNEVLARKQLQLDQATAAGRVDAAKGAALQIEQINRRIQASSERLALAQRSANTATAAESVAQTRVSGAQRSAMLSGGLGFMGNALLGVGAAGTLAGGYFLKQGMNWQTYGSQQLANSPMDPRVAKQFQALSLRLAGQTGANPEDILLSLRYGSELLTSRFGARTPAMDRQVLRSALMLGLPTGGSAAVAPSAMAIGTVMNNFPTYRDPKAIANMILAASQNSAGVSAPQFATAMPQFLTIAGHIGGKDQLQQSLAIVAALTSSGMPLDEAETQAKNLVAKVFKPSPATLKWVAGFDKANNTNLASDFGPQALRQKGLAGVINDLHGMQFDPAILGHLFPNLRGYFGALGLTGNQYTSFTNILGRVNGAPGQNPIGANFDRYLKLDSTQAKMLQQQLHVLAITVGTELLPPFNHFLKDEVVPGVKDISNFTHEHKQLIAHLIQLSPLILGAGVGIKGLNAAMNLAHSPAGKLIGDLLGIGTNAKTAAPEVGGLATATSTLGKDAAISGEIQATATAEEALGLKASAAAPEVDALATSELGLAANAGKAEIAIGAEGGAGFLGALGRIRTFFAENPMVLPALGMAYGAAELGQHFKLKTPAWKKGGALPNYNDTPVRTWDSTHAPSAHGVFGQFHAVTANYTSADDRRMLQAWGIKTHGQILDTDFASGPPGSKAVHNVVLPGGSAAKWKLLKAGVDPNTGGYEVWQSPNGGIITLLHMSKEQQLVGPHREGLSWSGSNWSGLKVGQSYGGGAVVGVSGHPLTRTYGNDPGFYHLCAVTDAQGREDVIWLTTGQMQKMQNEGKSTRIIRGQATNWHLTMKAVPTNIARYGGAIVQAAQKYRLPPALIAAIINQESGSGPANYKAVSPAGAEGLMQLMPGTAKQYGVKNSFNAAQNIMGGAAYFAYLLNGPAHGDVTTALEMYNAGPHGPYQKSAGYAKSVLALVPGYGGMGGPTTKGKKYVMPSGSSGTGPKPALSDVQDAFNQLVAPYRRKDGTIDFRRMPTDDRAVADNLLRLMATVKLAEFGNTLNIDVGENMLPKATADRMYQRVQRQQQSQINDPEKYYNTGHLHKGAKKDAAYWSSRWGSKASRDQKHLGELLKPYTGSDGTVDWAKMPMAVRHAADALINGIAFDDYMSDRGTYNADIKNPNVRGPLISASWTQYLSHIRNAEGWWNGSHVTGAGGASAGAQAWHVVSRNCEAALHQLPINERTAHNTGVLVGHAASQTQLLRRVLNVLGAIHDQGRPARVSAARASRGGGRMAGVAAQYLTNQ